MTADCSLLNWYEISKLIGPYIRPGGFSFTKKAIEVCRFPVGSRIVDIGCGVGGTLKCLEQSKIYKTVGLDYSETLTGEALYRLTSTCLVRGRAESLPFKEGSFDALFCECVFSTLSKKLSVLNELKRVLKDGGFLIISDVFCQGDGITELPVEKSNLNGTNEYLTKNELLSIVQNLGFSILHWEENRDFIGEFVAKLILAGHKIPSSWRFIREQQKCRKDCFQISYFLLVGRLTKMDNII